MDEPATGRPAPYEPSENQSAPNEPIPLGFPDPGSVHPEPSSTAGPAPEPEASPQREPIEVEPHTSVEPVAEPSGPAAPAQVAPEAGAPPIPFEPEPSVPEPVSLEPEAPVSLAPETAATLALPPTTREVEPPPSVPSAPPPPSGVPVPFAAPPTERSRYFGLRLGLGIGGGAVLIGVTVIAVFFAIFVFTNSITDKVEDTAAEFIGAVAEDDWDTAYAMLCDDYRDRPVDDYVNEWESWDAEGAEIQSSPNATEVPVEFDDGTAVILYIEIDQTPERLDTSVCGWRTPSGQ